MNRSVAARITTRVLDGFDDPTFGPDAWESLLSANGIDVVYLTWPWQRAWWETFGRGELLLIAAERDGLVVALAPFYADDGAVYFIGWGDEGDNLDFIGDVSDPDVLDAILVTAAARVENFYAFHLFYMPAARATRGRVLEAAARLGFVSYREWDMPAPAIELDQNEAGELLNGRRHRKRERYFTRDSSFLVRQTSNGAEIRAGLDEFFDQHVTRWTGRKMPSAFVDERQRTFVRRLTELAGDAGWLRFTRIEWNGRPLCFHFGYCYRGRYFWNEPSFDIALAHRSPGHVLLRQLVHAARAEGARLFDFGTVDQDFKIRVATRINYVQGCRLAAKSGV